MKKLLSVVMVITMIGCLSIDVRANELNSESPVFPDYEFGKESNYTDSKEEVREEDKAEEINSSLESEGICGNSVEWQLYSNGKLVISGAGKMNDYSAFAMPPWADKYVSEVIIEQGVTDIGEYAFANCRNLTDIILPQSLTRIGAQAFFYSGLNNIVIPQGITEIEDSTFYFCSGLTSIVFPQGLATIGNEAFYNCSSLDSIIIPQKVDKIGDSAFEHCYSLSSVTLSDGLTWIGSYAFADSSLTDITIPQSVTSIGRNAFIRCNSLTSVAIPDNVASAERLFPYCNNLKEIKVGGANKVYSAKDGILFDKKYTRLICYPPGKKDSDYVIPETVSIIGSLAFSCSSNLKNITIPDTVSSIEDGAFIYCTSLNKISIPKSVESVGDYAFEYCSNLHEIEIKGDAPLILTNSVVPDIRQGCSKDLVIKVPNDAKGYDVFPWSEYNIAYIEKQADNKLSPVTGLKAVVAGKNKVRLTWGATPKAEGYLIYAQKDKKYGYCGMTSGTTFTDLKALDNDYNFYWVFPYVKDSTGKMHPGGCTKYVYAKGVTVAVTNLKALNQKSGVKLTWSASSGAEGYLIYGKTATGKYGYKGMTTKGVTFTDRKASKKEYNFYWVFPYHKDKTGKMITGGTPKYVYGKAY